MLVFVVTNPKLLDVKKYGKNLIGFIVLFILQKTWQSLKLFSGVFHRAQTLKFKYRYPYSGVWQT